MVFSRGWRSPSFAYLNFKALGPDPDPNGVYRHFAIDFTGMAFMWPQPLR
jgi:hypothetical protein